MSDTLRQIAAAMHLPPDQTDDVVQEVWAAAVENAGRFSGANTEDQLCRWMCQVMHNKTIDAIRRLQRAPGSLEALPVEPSAPEELEIERERRAWLVEQLVEASAEASVNGCLLCGHFHDGRKQADLAAELGITANAVKCRLCREVKELRQKAAEVGLVDNLEDRCNLEKKL